MLHTFLYHFLFCLVCVSAGNWHSILRIGLRNYSNTPLMSAGAAYGPGIYLAPNSNVSIGYAHCAGVSLFFVIWFVTTGTYPKEHVLPSFYVHLRHLFMCICCETLYITYIVLVFISYKPPLKRVKGWTFSHER